MKTVYKRRLRDCYKILLAVKPKHFDMGLLYKANTLLSRAYCRTKACGAIGCIAGHYHHAYPSRKVLLCNDWAPEQVAKHFGISEDLVDRLFGALPARTKGQMIDVWEQFLYEKGIIK